MKKLPIGIQTFSTLINEQYVYVDKTHYIHELITTGKYYFLARPRRFGKSLLVSTIKSIFSGEKHLFDGLAITSLPHDWQQHPVIMISFADIAGSTPEELDEGIKIYLQRIAKDHAITLDKDVSSGQMLRDFVINMAKNSKVVLLIDEYDYAILRHVHNPEMADKIRETLRKFYDVIKGLDPYLKFVLLTGVSQFSKTSIFSGLNNLEDISFSEEYNTLLGYTHDEITTYFNEYLTNTAHKKNWSKEHLLQEITDWYDGYRFTRSHNALKMYNPFSVMLCLKKSEFSNYWFETGTPTFLINLLKSKNYPIQDFEGVQATDNELKQFDFSNINLKTILFQTGYLTIKDYNEYSGNYVLGYPNKENTRSSMEYIFASMTNISGAHLYNIAASLTKIFEEQQLKQLHAALTHLFAIVPYTIHIGEEKYYQTIFYIVLKMIGAHIIVEQPTNIGRIDAVLETQNTYFIIEFKINSTAQKAIEQIESKQYYQPYESQGKKIILVGIAFDTTLKNVSDITYKEHNYRN